jgi:hypothetical protein
MENSKNNYSSNLVTEQELIVVLEKAVEGLLWYSESEYPLQVIAWHDLDNFDFHTLLQYSNHPADTKIITKEFYSFFATVAEEQEWHNEAEKAETKRYQNLVNLLNNNLQNLQVYLVGEIEIDVYILGEITSQTIDTTTPKSVKLSPQTSIKQSQHLTLIGLHTKIIAT